jgi:hypothetical protein
MFYDSVTLLKCVDVKKKKKPNPISVNIHRQEGSLVSKWNDGPNCDWLRCSSWLGSQLSYVTAKECAVAWGPLSPNNISVKYRPDKCRLDHSSRNAMRHRQPYALQAAICIHELPLRKVGGSCLQLKWTLSLHNEIWKRIPKLGQNKDVKTVPIIHSSLQSTAHLEE